MAGELTITATEVAPVVIEPGESLTRPCAVAIAAGESVYEDTNGRWAKAAATSAAAMGNRTGIALRSGKALEAITVMFKGLIDLGPSAALDAVTNDAPIYQSDTAARIATSAGTVSRVLGTVTTQKTGTLAAPAVSKLLRLNS